MSDQQSAAAVAEPAVETPSQQRERQRNKPKRLPPFNVVLWDDSDHTYDYVEHMMQELFGHSKEKSHQIAVEVDTNGKAICLTTTKEHAELKKDQIHAFGRDKYIPRCSGSMWATIEPVPQ